MARVNDPCRRRAAGVCSSRQLGANQRTRHGCFGNCAPRSPNAHLRPESEGGKGGRRRRGWPLRVAGLQPWAATYTVTARLEGFETVTVMVRAHDGVDSSFTIRLHLECYEPDFEVVPDLRPLVTAADLVALVRLDSIERGQQARIGDDWCGPITIFRGTIIEPVKDRRPQR